MRSCWYCYLCFLVMQSAPMCPTFRIRHSQSCQRVRQWPLESTLYYSVVTTLLCTIKSLPRHNINPEFTGRLPNFSGDLLEAPFRAIDLVVVEQRPLQRTISRSDGDSLTSKITPLIFRKELNLMAVLMIAARNFLTARRSCYRIHALVAEKARHFCR